MSPRPLPADAVTPCPTEASLALYAAQRLPQAERRAVEAHVESCEACDLALAVIRTASAASLSVQGSTASLVAFERRARLARELVPGAPLGRFRLLRRMGAGAMGVVFAAYDPELDRKVALKVLLDDAGDAADAARSERLVREARSMAKLTHPNAVAAYQIGVADGRVFLAMELVEGTTLREWLATGPRTGEVVRLFELVARAVDTAHRAGIVHRDLKPQNILVSRDGQPKVTDFGLADASAASHAAAEQSIDTSATITTQATRGLVGTPAYMAPEALAGGRAGPAADQFALAVCLHEALAGRRPFVATTLDALRAETLRGAPALDRRIAPQLRAVVARALSPAPAGRFPSAAAFGDALIAAGRSADTRGRRALATAAVVSLAAVAGVAVFAVRRPPAVQTDEASPPLSARAVEPSASALRERPPPAGSSTPASAVAVVLTPPVSAQPRATRPSLPHREPPPAPSSVPAAPNAEPAADLPSDWLRSRR